MKRIIQTQPRPILEVMVESAATVAISVKKEKAPELKDKVDFGVEAFRQLHNKMMERSDKHQPYPETWECPTKLRRMIRNQIYSMQVKQAHG